MLNRPGDNSAEPKDVAVEVPLVAEVLVPIVAPHLHMRARKAGNKCIYLNDLGNSVMLGNNGRSYPVGVDGSQASKRPPSGMGP